MFSITQLLDLKVAHADVARAIEEIIFCTVHPQLTGPHRREQAIKTYSECATRVDLLKFGIKNDSNP